VAIISSLTLINIGARCSYLRKHVAASKGESGGAGRSQWTGFELILPLFSLRCSLLIRNISLDLLIHRDTTSNWVRFYEGHNAPTVMFSSHATSRLLLPCLFICLDCGGACIKFFWSHLRLLKVLKSSSGTCMHFCLLVFLTPYVYFTCESTLLSYQVFQQLTEFLFFLMPAKHPFELLRQTE